LSRQCGILWCGMVGTLKNPQETETELDAELQALLQQGEAALDDKTRAFIAEVLRHVPKERPRRFEVKISHEGAFCGNEG